MGMALNSSESSNHHHHQPNGNKNKIQVTFQIITTILLSLLLPLSFLLLARLSTAHYLFSVSDNYPSPLPTSFLCSLFLNPKTSTILHLLVSLVSVSTLSHALTGKITILSQAHLTRPCLYVAWIFLCVLQVCVGFGIEGSIAAGIDGSAFGHENSLLGRAIFFLGLHETMLFWRGCVVKPVVDDTVFGGLRGEGWVERAAVGMSYGWLWWWRVREEVESLLVVPEVKRELMMEIGVADFMGWWLYYLTVTIGMVRVVKGLVWAAVILTRRRRRDGGESRQVNDDKV